MATKPKTIFKLVPSDVWRKAEAEGNFTGAGVDIKDGFIHFSTQEQVQRTAHRFFKGQADVLLVAINCEPISEKLRWEQSASGGIFPHLYEPLDLSLVMQVTPLPLLPDGSGAHDLSQCFLQATTTS